MAHHRIKVIISMILLAISTLCTVYAPKVAENIIKLITNNHGSYDHNAVFGSVVLLFILYVLGYLFRLPSNRLMVFVGEEIAYKLRMELFDKIELIDSKYFQENSKGHILSRLNNDLLNVKEFISIHLSEIFAKSLSIFFVIILILMTDWRLSLIYLIALPIYVVCFYCADIKSKNQYENHQKRLGIMMSYLERSLVNRNPSHEKDFEKINKVVSDNYVKSINVSNVIRPVTTFLINVGNMSVYIIGVYFLITNQIELGTLLAVIIYGHLLTKPIKELSATLISLETSFSSIKRIFDIIDFKNTAND